MTDTAVKPEASDSPEADKKDEKPNPETLGASGKKALDAEREARKKAESDLSSLRSEFKEFRQSITEAFGGKAKADDDENALENVQAQLKALQHDALVFQLAAQHQITDDGDVELLKAASSDYAPKLAERLAKAADAKPGSPKPDRSQGGSEPVKPDPGPGVSRMAAAFEESLEGRDKT